MHITPEQIRRFLGSRSRKVIDQAGLTRAGVLMLLYPRDDELHVLLTKRTSDVEHHKGQVSFPGGSVDSRDRDIVATALRESEEEIGLPQDRVDVLGLFDDVWTPSGFAITPVIGYTRALPSLIPSRIEVEEIVEIPVSFFLDSGNERTKRMERQGQFFEVYFFTYGAIEVWGATAAMLRSFLHELSASHR